MSDTADTPAPAVTESDVDLGDGHVLHVYDTGDPGTPDVEPLVVVWHHGTPEHRRAAAAALRRGGPPRHPLGVLRPARLRRLDRTAGS